MTAATILVSCSNESVEIRGEEQVKVGFSTLLTRGSSINSAADVASAGGFSVWAYKHTGPWTTAIDKTILIDNAGGYGHVTSVDGVTWDYGAPQYWPLVKKVSFFAYTPHGYASWDGTLTNDDIPVIECTVPLTAADQKDMMIAVPVYDDKGPDPVQENFHHALSRITFSALKADNLENKVVKINSIAINGVNNKGTTPLLTPVVWSVNELSKQDYKLSVLGGSLNNISLTISTDQDLLPSGGTLFMMPQTFPSGANLVIEFTNDGKNLRWSGEIPAPTTWEVGKSYHYKLLIDGDLVAVICGQLESPSTGTDWGNY